ncbi:hypothetical protein GCM10020258_56070 [Sphingomonas yabuuchiae]
MSNSASATGSIEFNDRNVAVVQARSGGFVQRVYARAPGDVVPAGAPLADILVPEWAGAQAEYLAVRRTGMPGSRGRHESACCFSGCPPDRLHRRSGAADRKV